MKKIFFSLVALAALAACSKSEVQYEHTDTITLAPIASNATKSVAGYNEDTFDGKFPTDINLCVFANAGENGSAPAAHSEVYFRNALFTWQNKGTNASVTEGSSTITTAGAYAGSPDAYFWPNVKTLVFAGHSIACSYDKANSSMNFSADVLSIPGYVQNNTTYKEEGENDLMWFSCTNPYDKQAEEIVTKMKHACSWITINVAGNDVTAGKWTLNSLVVKNIAHKGNAECGSEKASWGAHDNYSDEAYYNLASGTTFTTSLTKYENNANNFIVIPQTPTALEVTYTYESDPVNHISFTETKEISLDWDGADGNKSWESGVHYIYNITITTTEILIDPVVTSWTEVNNTNTSTTI